MLNMSNSSKQNQYLYGLIVHAYVTKNMIMHNITLSLPQYVFCGISFVNRCALHRCHP